MSNESSAKIAAARRDWKTEHLEMYLGSGGVEGHIVNVSDRVVRPGADAAAALRRSARPPRERRTVAESIGPVLRAAAHQSTAPG